MRKAFLLGAFLVGLLAAGNPLARAQTQAQAPAESHGQSSSSDLAVTYTMERATVTPTGAGAFWLQGGSLDAATTFFHGFGVAGNVTGDYASHIAPGVNLEKIYYMAGPRYTRELHVNAKRQTRAFGELLLGGVRGFDGVFPVSGGISNHASSFAWQAGGGSDIAISKHFNLRAIEADYVRNYLPNNGANTQGQLRLSFGVSYHIQKH